MMTDDELELRRIAAHESGHAAMSKILHVPNGTVSVRPGLDYAGLAIQGKSGRPKVRDEDLDVPIVEMRPSLRRGIEREIVISLAGRAAERLSVPPELGYVADPDRERAERLASLAIPVGREAAALEGFEREGSGGGDLKNAMSKSHGAVGAELQNAYLFFLEGVTNQIVSTPRFRRLVDALVPPLLKHRVLSARAVRMILAYADKEQTHE